MLPHIAVEADRVDVTLLLTVGGCPMREQMINDITAAASAVAGVREVHVTTQAMTKDERETLRKTLTGGGEPVIPFTQPDNRTRILAIASGKGGVGKSSLTANLAVAMAAQGLTVGLLDADVYGHSIPRLLGVNTPPMQVEGLLMPPVAHGVRVLSADLMKPSGFAEPIAFRGPMLHKVLMQFLADTWWGDLDVLILDTPPGTGDMPMSIGQTLPHSELVMVTTPHIAAAEVAVRAGMLAAKLGQRIIGVVENMSAFPCPSCGELTYAFGRGGGTLVAETLSKETNQTVGELPNIPFDVRMSEEDGVPFVLRHPSAPASVAIQDLASAIRATARPKQSLNLPLVTR